MANEQAQELKEYEILYFISISLEPDEIQAIKKKINDIITNRNGVIIKEDEIGKRKLAFMIKRARHGYYILTVFKSPTTEINNVNHEIELLPEILRHKIAIKEEIKIVEIKDEVKPDKVEKEPKKEEEKTEDDTKDKKEDKKDSKVDIEELDRKIDELLAEEKL